jgi:hypothetical protein
MKVTNLTSVRSGAPVANQFEIQNGNESVFQSYNTTIAKKQGYSYIISSDWNYSNTTNRYFGQWLREYGWTEEEIKTLKKFLTKANEGDTLEVGNCKVTYINEL